MSSRFARSLTDITERIDQRFAVKPRWEAVREFTQNHPMRAMFFGTIFATVIIPVMVFLFVVGSSLVIGLSALFCIQGAVLTAATVALVPALACCVLCASGFTVLAFVAGYAFRAAEWTWGIFYGSVGAPASYFVSRSATNMSNFNFRSKFALPSVNCKVTGKIINKNDNGSTRAQAQGDQPHIRARMVYTAADVTHELQNED